MTFHEQDEPQRRFWPATGDCDLASMSTGKAKSRVAKESCCWLAHEPRGFLGVSLLSGLPQGDRKKFLQSLLRKLQRLGQRGRTVNSQFPAIDIYRSKTHQTDAKAVTRTVRATPISRSLLSKCCLMQWPARNQTECKMKDIWNQEQQWTMNSKHLGRTLC